MPDSQTGPEPLSKSSPRSRPGRALRRESTLLAACILLLLVATVPPLINLGRYQRRVADAISHSIGRPVSMDSISLRLLPWPAFMIDNLSVSEDPKFGAEPALVAPEVVIEPRLSSLWRGRFELNRVELTDASVNLVRLSDGRWNISSVLLQASQIQNAPTTQRAPGPAPRFPYIEATGTRVNLKHGEEKLPYSLLNADFSMWLARPDVWQIKLEGQPVRTDLELSLGDTGLLHVDGELHRASALGTMPLTVTSEWSHAPLGQLSRLLLGRDANWRGDIDATAQINGEINHLDLRTHLVILNLHRQEFTPEQPFTVDATCGGHYSRSQSQTDALHCRWPVGDGALVFSAIAAPSGPQTTLEANKVPAAFLASAIGLVRPGAPAAQRFAGELSGSLTYDTASATFAGDAAMPALSIAGAGPDGTALVIHGIAAHAVPGRQPSLAITSEPVDLGIDATPLALAAELTRQGYTLHARGSATLPSLAAAAKGLRLPSMDSLSAASLSLNGTQPAIAQMALTSSGGWSGEETPDQIAARAMGSLRFENVRWNPAWLPVPVHLVTVTASISPGMIRWDTPLATVAADRATLRFAAEASMPIDCPTSKNCRAQVSIHADSLDAQTLETALLSPGRPMLTALLDRMDAAGSSTPAIPEATGSIHAGVFTLDRLAIRDTSAVWATDAQPSGGTSVRIESLDGKALGGTVHLRGSVSVNSDGPKYAFQLLAAGISAPEAAALWHESWGPGTLGGEADFTLAGKTETDLLDSIKGTIHASWLHGSLAPALPHFASWDGAGSLGANGLTLTQSTLSGRPATLSGSIGWDRTLHLQLLETGEGPANRIIGTLAAPENGPPADQ